MKRKILFWMIAMLTMMVSAHAYSMCDWGTKEINKNCTMPTPHLIGCTSYNYTIINVSSGEVIINEELKEYPTPVPDFYRFNITVPEGEYLLTLCDGTSMQFTVKYGGERMIAAALLLGFVLIIMAWYSRSLPQEWVGARFLLFVFSFIIMLAMLSFGLSLFVGADSSQFTIFDTTVSVYYLFLTIFTIVLSVYFLKKEFEKYKIKKIMRGEMDGNNKSF